MSQPTPLSPPVADRRPVTFTTHGHDRTDPYAWLRDPDWQAVMRDPAKLQPEIRAYLEAENAWTDATLAPLADLRTRLVEEMKGRLSPEDAGVPVPDGPWAYFGRFVPGGQHAQVCRVPSDQLDAEPAVLIDADKEAAGTSFFDMADWGASPDHRLIAWSTDTAGSEVHTIRFRDVATGLDLPDRIEGAHGDFAWAADSIHLYWTGLDDEHRPQRVLRHRIGSTEPDTLIYAEPDPGFFVGVGTSESDRWIVINSHDHATSEIRLIDAASQGDARIVAPREEGVEYDVSEAGGRLFIRTNADGAEDYKIVEVACDAAPGRTAWRDVVPHRPGTLVLGIAGWRDWLVRLERENGLPRIVVRHLADGAEHAIAFDEEAYELGLGGTFGFDGNNMRFGYASPSTPRRVYDYNMATRTRTLRKTQVVPSGHEPADYVVRRLMAPTADGETVPVTLLHRRDLVLDGTPPVLLYGYGSYGSSVPCGFSANRFSLVDRGFVYAIAHIRGGMEKGYRWYRDGKLAKKPNTFSDFIAAADYLIAQRLAEAGNIVAHGGSAGGMLVGAVVNMRPELFAGAVAEVPFVDCVNTILDATLPLTPPEWPEWGDPIRDEAAYRTMLSYSPYDNVRPQAYPNMLVTAGLTDPRVTYWEPAKWVAKLRATSTGDKLLLLRTEMTAGHGGAAGRYDKLIEVALVYAFALMVTGKMQTVAA